MLEKDIHHEHLMLHDEMASIYGFFMKVNDGLMLIKYIFNGVKYQHTIKMSRLIL